MYSARNTTACKNTTVKNHHIRSKIYYIYRCHDVGDPVANFHWCGTPTTHTANTHLHSTDLHSHTITIHSTDRWCHHHHHRRGIDEQPRSTKHAVHSLVLCVDDCWFGGGKLNNLTIFHFRVAVSSVDVVVVGWAVSEDLVVGWTVNQFGEASVAPSSPFSTDGCHSTTAAAVAAATLLLVAAEHPHSFRSCTSCW